MHPDIFKSIHHFPKPSDLSRSGTAIFHINKPYQHCKPIHSNLLSDSLDIFKNTETYWAGSPFFPLLKLCRYPAGSLRSYHHAWKNNRPGGMVK